MRSRVAVSALSSIAPRNEREDRIGEEALRHGRANAATSRSRRRTGTAEGSTKPTASHVVESTNATPQPAGTAESRSALGLGGLRCL